MLNGKFFTGLPPKMIERGGANRNRLESHFFWPDDSHVESAVETRVRRRNSIQLQECNKPIYEKQMSVGDNDVDTKQRFSKEFSQSSIQFYDNLNDNNSASRRRLRTSVGAKKTELTEKPNATKQILPESVVDEAYTTAKKKQAYMSKIQFYDFVNEEDNAGTNRNNLRRLKMDMNDKREMELNSKNSPKLQMKRDVRSLSEEKEMPKINNREVKTLDRSRQIKEVNVNRVPSKRDNERYTTTYRRANISPNRSLARNSYAQRHVEDRDNYRTSERNNDREQMSKTNSMDYENENNRRYSSDQSNYHNSGNAVLSKESEYRNYDREPEIYETRRYSNRSNDTTEDFVEEPQYRRVRNDTKKNRESRETREYNNDYEEEIGSRIKTVRIDSSPPRRHHYHREEYYEEDQEPEQYPRGRVSLTEQTKRGNYQRHSDYNERDRYEVDLPYEEKVEIIQSNNKTPIKRVANKLNNEIQIRRENSASPGPSSNRAPSPDSPSSRSAPLDINKPQKHLRSSLCFHDGAIIAENDATRSPTSQKPTPRRNIRSTATKRVSVGLPD